MTKEVIETIGAMFRVTHWACREHPPIGERPRSVCGRHRSPALDSDALRVRLKRRGVANAGESMHKDSSLRVADARLGRNASFRS
jgi:hypothetical protein